LRFNKVPGDIRQRHRIGFITCILLRARELDLRPTV
jgi:hypothetical protein